LNWYGTSYTIPLMIGTVICVILIFFTWIRRPNPGAGLFTWAMLAIGEWSLAYALELNANSFAVKLYWAKVEYFGIATLPVAWTAFVTYYNGWRHWIKARYIALLLVIPVLSIALVWTNNLHHLMWKNTFLTQGIFFKVLHFTYGWWFWLLTGYSYLLLLGGMISFIFGSFGSPSRNKTKAALLLFSISLPFIANLVYVFNFFRLINFDLTPFAFVITGLILSGELMHFNLLEVVPVARYAVVENMSDLVMVLNLQNRLVDLNPAALRFISHSTVEVIGQPVEKVLAAWPDLISYFAAEKETEIVLVEDTAEHFFDCRISSLCNRRGRLTGRLIILRDITEQKRVDKLESILGKLQKTMTGIIQTMALMVEMKDPYTAGHQRRVAKIAHAIAIRMALPDLEIETISMAAVIHDIGKINIPAEILNKPGYLTDAEFATIQTHPEVGFNILKTIDFPWPIAKIVRQHHEKMNGSGYPKGLMGPDILLAAKIIVVADVVESMSNERPYRPALGIEKALEEIARNRGILYDEHVVDVCLAVLACKDFDFELTDLNEA
jgi:putative nucleotidyltransferase with HDIG domain